MNELKKIKPAARLIMAAVLVELCVCNFSAWRSLFYQERISFESVRIEGVEEIGDGDYRAGKDPVTIYIDAEGRELHNLFFDMGFSEMTKVPYTITLTDEGNYYPYALPEGEIVPWLQRSSYTNLYPAGKVETLTVSLTVPEGSIVTLRKICANAHIPFRFSTLRFLAVLGMLLLGYVLPRAGKLQDSIYFGEGRTKRDKSGRNDKERMQQVVTAAVILLLIAMAWKLAHVNPVCITAPWPHHRQYQELAEAMATGQVHLDMKPSDVLLQVENPYDTIRLQAEEIDYRADYAYYEGKYYVYFGVVPELLLYLPCYLLTGHQLPNYMAVFFFYCGFILAVFALYRELIKNWFRQTPFILYLFISALTVCGGNYLFVIARPDMYDVPIMAATMFTAGGLWLWFKGKYAAGRQKGLCLLAGSLCMALVAGCRPQMLLFSFLAVPLFWEEVVVNRELFTKRSVGATVCICAPYLAVAAGIMYYNAARFGSPLDFGAAYSLTSNDMTKRSFNLHRMLLGIWHYFFQPPIVGSDFPFLQGNQIVSASYMGKLNSEYTYGGILACNAFVWSLLLVGKGKRVLKKKGSYAFVLVSLGTALAIAAVDVTGAGILQRYMVDMVWGIWLAAVIMVLAAAQRVQNTGYYRTMMGCLAAAAMLQALYGFGVVLGNGDLSVNVRSSNPILYYGIKSLFMF